MDFVNLTTDIIEWMKIKLPIYLGEDVKKPNKYIEDYFDTDKYKDNIVLYLTPDPEYSFEEYSNESKLLNHSLDLFVTFKGDTEAKLSVLAKKYIQSIYLMIKENHTMGDVLDYAMIESIKYYDGIEGVQSSKAIYIKIKTIKEV